jgi:hypothetical protein
MKRGRGRMCISDYLHHAVLLLKCNKFSKIIINNKNNSSRQGK